MMGVVKTGEWLGDKVRKLESQMGVWLTSPETRHGTVVEEQ